MSWERHPAAAPPEPALDVVTSILDPVLLTMGFAGGQTGAAADEAQVIFCRGGHDDVDEGCGDLVVVLRAAPEWRVVEVRYWGFPSDRWHLHFDADGALVEQVHGLARTLPEQLP